MFDAQCDIAALVYKSHEDPDAVLRDFADDISNRGFRAVGLVQLGHYHFGEAQLAAQLIHSGETLSLFRTAQTGTAGCRLDIGRLIDAGCAIAGALDAGADVLIINRYGKQERGGKGLSYLIARAAEADIPVIIAVPEFNFADWIRFAEGMSVRLPCRLAAAHAWWDGLSCPAGSDHRSPQQNFCEALK